VTDAAPAMASAPMVARRTSANAFLQAPLLPTLLRLALPNLIALSVTAAVAIAETSYVGILGTAPLAAIALVFPMLMLMQMLSSGAMGGGVSSAISRALGAGDEVRARALPLHALAIGAGTGLFFSLLFTLFGRALFATLGGRGAVLDQAMAYANVALSAAVLVWVLNTLASIVRGTGNMQIPSLTLLGVSALQIGFGGALGLGIGPIPRFGLPGVAAGLVIGCATGTLYLLWHLGSGRGRLRLRFTGIPLRAEMFLDILKVGAIASFSPLQSVLTVLILTRAIAGFGTEALAGYGIGARLEFLLVPIAFAVGVACVPMVGMAVGAGRIGRARRVAWTGAAVSALALGLIGGLAATLPHLWSGLFSADAEVVAAANLYLRCAGPTFPLFGLGLCLYFASQGAGKVLGPVLASSLRLGIVAVGTGLLAWSQAPLWCLFGLVGLSLAAYGAATAAAVYVTPWGRERVQVPVGARAQ
jgi:MATE family, multidrug efflux pump